LFHRPQIAFNKPQGEYQAAYCFGGSEMTTQTPSPKSQSPKVLNPNRVTDALPVERQALVVKAGDPQATAKLIAEIYAYLLARRRARLAQHGHSEAQQAS
jgi:hypothetical protein